MRGDLLVLGSAAALAAGAALSQRDGALRETLRAGSASCLAYKQKTPDHELHGVAYGDPVSAFDHVAWQMFDQEYWHFLAVDEDDPECSAVAWKLVAYLWKTWHGLEPGDRVFAWDTLYVQSDQRGRGLGRATVTRIEDMFRKDGIRAVILQAGHIDLGSKSSQAFWERVGYTVWPGHYEDTDTFSDRIMVKVLT